MKKFLVTESEIKDIKYLYKSKGILLQEAITGVVPNWEAAKAWVMAKTDKEPVEGDYPEGDPDYHFAKYKNDQANYMEIKSNGLAQEADSNFKLVHNGTWKWNGSEVIFSWLGTKRAGDNWTKAKDRLKTNGVEDYKLVSPKTPFDQTKVTYNDGEWAQGGYNYAKLTQDFDGELYELEIRDNFTWRTYDRNTNDVRKSGKWSWDGSKIVFGRGVTKKSLGLLSDDDTDLYTAIMVKNKIGKIGAKGPVVKELQNYISNWFSGAGVGKDDLGVGCSENIEKCDGIYGPKTKEAVKKVQSYYDIKEDGIFGKETYNALRVNQEEESDID